MLIGHNLFYTFIEFQELDCVYILYRQGVPYILSFKMDGSDANLGNSVASATEGVPTTSEQRAFLLSLSSLSSPTCSELF